MGLASSHFRTPFALTALVAALLVSTFPDSARGETPAPGDRLTCMAALKRAREAARRPYRRAKERYTQLLSERDLPAEKIETYFGPNAVVPSPEDTSVLAQLATLDRMLAQMQGTEGVSLAEMLTQGDWETRFKVRQLLKGHREPFSALGKLFTLSVSAPRSLSLGITARQARGLLDDLYGLVKLDGRLSYRDWYGAAAEGHLRSNLRKMADLEYRKHGLVRILDEAGLLRDRTVKDRLLDFAASREVSWVFSVLTHIRAHHGFLGELPRMKVHFSPEILRKIYTDGVDAHFEEIYALYGKKVRRNAVYQSVVYAYSAIGWVIAGAIMYAHYVEKKEKAEKEAAAQAQEKELFEALDREKDAIAEEMARIERLTLPELRWDAWLRDYADRNDGAAPDTTSAEYRSARRQLLAR